MFKAWCKGQTLQRSRLYKPFEEGRVLQKCEVSGKCALSYVDLKIEEEEKEIGVIDVSKSAWAGGKRQKRRRLYPHSPPPLIDNDG